ncbi:MFS transporter [Oceanihabitans sp. 2_MG-2023]|uniref:MDR family MFS transporter n=1 Tax=Oceanihabitans sp. 2_MG-2023 TaxID=3062661 RepID=UPI0026E12427|nr:MFS transporter [Oceanihabitans sp. 2_MG-2023]MDO6598370.1 MFS transporter [Oceanihabitans sp. 2_MG-2023]
MKTLFHNYINTFKGLSTEVWWLALITLINRAGTMVIPFLSLYLTEDLNFTLKDVGWIMSAFGLGSVVGSWLGGKLTDKIGYYKVMVRSLLFTGILFVALQFLNTFTSLCIGIFLVMLVADMFRPAMFVALSAYSKPENKTRSVTLIRLAINLGFSAGPAVGGLIITTMSYSGLFWVDGITCILATLVLILVLNPKKAKILDNIIVENPDSAYNDKAFLIFLVAMFLFGFVFLQYFSTMPIYYRETHTLTELQIGLLLGANGFFIFLLEMPLIKWLENSKYSKSSLMFFGAALTALSFIVLNLTTWSGILIIGMFLMTIGEMIAFPFSNAFAMQRAKKGNQGEYMALYSIAFSFAHIFGHNAGMQFADGFGFNNTWSIMTLLGVLCALLLFGLNIYMKKNITKSVQNDTL